MITYDTLPLVRDLANATTVREADNLLNMIIHEGGALEDFVGRDQFRRRLTLDGLHALTCSRITAPYRGMPVPTVIDFTQKGMF